MQQQLRRITLVKLKPLQTRVWHQALARALCPIGGLDCDIRSSVCHAAAFGAATGRGAGDNWLEDMGRRAADNPLVENEGATEPQDQPQDKQQDQPQDQQERTASQEHGDENIFADDVSEEDGDDRVMLEDEEGELADEGAQLFSADARMDRVRSGGAILHSMNEALRDSQADEDRWAREERALGLKVRLGEEHLRLRALHGNSKVNSMLTREIVAYFTHSFFNLPVFIAEWLTHVLYPWSLPFMMAFYGMNYCRNHMFFNFKGFLPVLGTHIVPVILWFIIALYIYTVYSPDYTDKPLSEQGIYVIELVQLPLYLAAHRATIACKYALMTTQERRIFYEEGSKHPKPGERSANEVVRLQMLLQVLTGWVSPSPRLIQSEIYAAALRMQLNLNAFAISLNPWDTQDQACWRRFLFMEDFVEKRLRKEFSAKASKGKLTRLDARPGSTAFADLVQRRAYEEAIKSWLSPRWPAFRNETGEQAPVTEIPVTMLLTSIFLRAVRVDEESFSTVLRFLLIVCVIVVKALMPCAIRVLVYDKRFLGENWQGRLLVLLNMITLAFFYLVTLSLINSSLVHYNRRYALLKTIGLLVRSDYTYHADMPIIQTTSPANVHAWKALHELALNVGSRYAIRLRYYTGFALLVAIAYAGWFAAQFLLTFISPGEDVSWNYVLLGEVLLDASVWTGFILAISLRGTSTNRLNFVQRVTLERQQLKAIDGMWVCRGRGFARLMWHAEHGLLNFRVPFGNVDPLSTPCPLTQGLSPSAAFMQQQQQQAKKGALPPRQRQDAREMFAMNEERDLAAEIAGASAPRARARLRTFSDPDAEEPPADGDRTVSRASNLEQRQQMLESVSELDNAGNMSPLACYEEFYGAEMERLVHAVEWTTQYLEVVDETRPETVVAVRADTPLISALFSVLLTLAAFTVRTLVF